MLTVTLAERSLDTSSGFQISDRARALGALLRADALAIEYSTRNTYDRRPESRKEGRLTLDERDALWQRRWRALVEEFSPTWAGHRGAWPNGHIQQ